MNSQQQFRFFPPILLLVLLSISAPFLILVGSRYDVRILLVLGLVFTALLLAASLYVIVSNGTDSTLIVVPTHTNSQRQQDQPEPGQELDYIHELVTKIHSLPPTEARPLVKELVRVSRLHSKRLVLDTIA